MMRAVSPGLYVCALGYELDAVVIEPSPRRVALPESRRRTSASRRSGRSSRAPSLRAGSSRRSEPPRRGAQALRRRHRPAARRHFLALRVPGVEPVALRAPYAQPLHLRQRDRDRHARYDCAVRRDRDDLGLQRRSSARRSTAGRRTPMYHGAGCTVIACAVRDVLARDVLHVAFERVGVRDSRVTLCWQRQRGARPTCVSCSWSLADALPISAGSRSDQPTNSQRSGENASRTAGGASPTGCLVKVHRSGRAPIVAPNR